MCLRNRKEVSERQVKLKQIAWNFISVCLSPADVVLLMKYITSPRCRHGDILTEQSSYLQYHPKDVETSLFTIAYE